MSKIRRGTILEFDGKKIDNSKKIETGLALPQILQGQTFTFPELSFKGDSADQKQISPPTPVNRLTVNKR